MLGANTSKEDSPEAIGLSYCNQLFAIEREAALMTVEDRHELRQKKSAPLLKSFFEWVDACSAKTLPQSLLGKALTYAQNQKKYLSVFLADGRIELSNNRAERSIKPFVIGRKNWLFCNTPGGAKSSATIYSLIQTAMENGLNPQAYLEYVFQQIQMNDDLDIETLLPWAKNIPESCKMPTSN